MREFRDEGYYIEKPAPDFNDSNGKEVVGFRVDAISDIVEDVTLEFVSHCYNRSNGRFIGVTQFRALVVLRTSSVIQLAGCVDC